jgi:hypothetical protein
MQLNETHLDSKAKHISSWSNKEIDVGQWFTSNKSNKNVAISTGTASQQLQLIWKQVVAENEKLDPGGDTYHCTMCSAIIEFIDSTKQLPVRNGPPETLTVYKDLKIGRWLDSTLKNLARPRKKADRWSAAKQTAWLEMTLVFNTRAKEIDKTSKMKSKRLKDEQVRPSWFTVDVVVVSKT